MWPMIFLTIASGLMQYQQGQRAADAQEAIARENARRKALETEEAIRRQRAEADKQEAQARARAAASGVTVSGSISEYLMAMEEANADKIAWLRKAGYSQADIIEKEGSLQADITRTNALGSLVGTAGSAYNIWKMG